MVEDYYAQFGREGIRKTDANNILLACGKQRVIELINRAEEIPAKNLKYLMDCENEYMHPDQEYRNKDTMPEIYAEHFTKVLDLEDDYLYFNIYRVDVNPPRIYINSSSKAYAICDCSCFHCFNMSITYCGTLTYLFSSVFNVVL